MFFLYCPYPVPSPDDTTGDNSGGDEAGTIDDDDDDTTVVIGICRDDNISSNIC